ncbi:hypothetical protein DFH29DRAFT_900868 [Suillus ampliporus]|nr:hypothetical protein DFH29DRAFT_900868 [Suillus ampliporus]
MILYRCCSLWHVLGTIAFSTNIYYRAIFLAESARGRWSRFSFRYKGVALMWASKNNKGLIASFRLRGRPSPPF